MSDGVRPVVRSIPGHVLEPDTPEVIDDLSSWAPSDPMTFAIDISFFVGDAADPPGMTDSFEILICSPSWLNAHLATLQTDDPRDPAPTAIGYRTGRGVWLMERWDPDALQQDVDALMADAAGANWPVVANRLSRHLDWEFDHRFDDAIRKDPPDVRPRPSER